LNMNMTVYMYSFIRKESKPICSFYIGIFEADGMRFPNPDNVLPSASEVVTNFNDAATSNIEDSWTR
jgi:hypothetical protein